jgi:uncharacterized membrane protein
MKYSKQRLQAAIASAVAIASTCVLTPTHAAEDAAQEKCYGIVKAEMNDCQTATAGCAGSATVDRQGDAFVLVPKGLCNKIVGSSLTPILDKKGN